MSVILSKPLKRGDQEITTITINDNIKQAGSLRGLRLVDVLNFDFDAVSTLLTRITTPSLTSSDVGSMATGDFTALCEEITPFLTKPAPSVPSEAETESE
ncbi:TPA: phage tail assembly protein [Klebsiella pneumoniae]|uniref:phage tail assembly protein n=1 Tax=Klebsiella pneumoniae TaxID=573 RepID=UPI000E2D80D2|nr:phage tail assembly protein [Klebsiella pneumoniae]EKX6201018.1 phage tail assembly protein [Klebsiella pneumoniae]MCE0275168.1 phage tail assembly protein [Klebsiella pneumoniae]MDT5434388.1 phage tail assembly protein [Klebsiella pneumoniae]SYR61976.1 Tail protein [Klebsiella pneumoniae]HDK5274763.1 phage tail assembly protein [Klebsiella pneumoniae]